MKSGDVEYVKNCGNTGEYHASGCIQIDDEEIGVKGTVCFCETENCNTSFEINGGDYVKLSILILVVSTILVSIMK